MTTAEQVAPIIHKTYGKSSFIDAMVEDVANHIDAGANEHQIMITCWLWMAGGDTAADVARQIVTRLEEVE